MQYLKLKARNTIIEFHNTLFGVETVIANGIQVTKLMSFLGAHHLFTIMEDGELVRYVLTSKTGNDLQCYIDLKRNGELIHEDVHLKLGLKPVNKYKQNGLKHLLKYDMEIALQYFEKAADIAPNDSSIYFYMACVYSNLEDADSGFYFLRKAVDHNLPNYDIILNHDMLAFLRMRVEFEDFMKSDFSEYELTDYINPVKLGVKISK